MRIVGALLLVAQLALITAAIRGVPGCDVAVIALLVLAEAIAPDPEGACR